MDQAAHVVGEVLQPDPRLRPHQPDALMSKHHYIDDDDNVKNPNPEPFTGEETGRMARIAEWYAPEAERRGLAVPPDIHRAVLGAAELLLAVHKTAEAAMEQLRRETEGLKPN